jgi:hypothetical protein
MSFAPRRLFSVDAQELVHSLAQLVAGQRHVGIVFMFARLYLGPMRLVDLAISIFFSRILLNSRWAHVPFTPFLLRKHAVLCFKSLLLVGAHSIEPSNLRSSDVSHKHPPHNKSHSHSLNIKRECGYRSAAYKMLLDKYKPFPSGHHIWASSTLSSFVAACLCNGITVPQGLLLPQVGFENGPSLDGRCAAATFSTIAHAPMISFRRSSSETSIVHPVVKHEA